MNKYIYECIDFTISIIKIKYVLNILITIGVVIGLLVGGNKINKKHKKKAEIELKENISLAAKISPTHNQ